MEAVLTGPLGRTLLGSSELTIGCDADNQLIVADLRTAAHHAMVRPDGLGYAILDLGSEYGTIVNGRWLEPNKARPLLPGDTIQIGNSKFTFEIFQNPAAIPTGILGVGIGDVGISNAEIEDAGMGNAPVPAPLSSFADIADHDTMSFNQFPNPPSSAATALKPAVRIPSLRSLLAQMQPQQPPYTPQPWVPDGVTAYPPQQQLWQQDRRRLYLALGMMLAIIIVFSIISLIVSRPTPDKTLDTFCNALLAGNGQLAYNQLSPKLQNQQGALLIAELSSNRATTCAHTSAIANGSRASATLTTKFATNPGLSNNPSKTLVTLIRDVSGAWKIDALQGISSKVQLLYRVRATARVVLVQEGYWRIFHGCGIARPIWENNA
jgi:pSer/pThr/pTyr-binding forkhead associated (FHA) protein